VVGNNRPTSGGDRMKVVSLDHVQLRGAKTWVAAGRLTMPRASYELRLVTIRVGVDI
jgi:hypothetical protein